MCGLGADKSSRDETAPYVSKFTHVNALGNTEKGTPNGKVNNAVISRPRCVVLGRTSPDAPCNDNSRGGALSLSKEEKQKIIEEYATHPGDTGSPEVQVALLSRRISDLTEHFKEHVHDHHSRRGLMLLVGQRKRLLAYLKEVDIERYRSLIQRLGLRR